MRPEPAHQGPGGGPGAHAHQGQERRHGRGAREEDRGSDQGMSEFVIYVTATYLLQCKTLCAYSGRLNESFGKF